MDEELQQFMALLRPFLDLMLGENSSGLSMLDMIEGKTHSYIRNQKYEQKRRKRLVDPFTFEHRQEIGEAYYTNILKALGYDDNSVKSHFADGGLGVELASWGFRTLAGMQLGDSDKSFLYAALDRRHNYNEPDAYRYMQDYGRIINRVREYAGTGAYSTLSTQDTLALGAHLISTGRYDGLPVSASVSEYSDPESNWSQRANKIHNDLTKLSRSVSRIRDALGGSMEEVLQAYENLSGSSVGVTATHRMDSISRLISNAYMYGGVTNESMIAQVNRMIQSNNGVGTQQLALTQGLTVAGAMSRPITVENASKEVVNTLLSSKQTDYLMSGSLKNLAAAYTWYLDGAEHSAGTWSKFQAELGGDLSDSGINSYLAKKGVSSSFINSTRVSNNMSLAELSQALTDRDIKFMEDNWKDAVSSWGLGVDDLSTEFLYMDADQLDSALLEKGIKDQNTRSRIADKVEQYRSIYAPGADSRDALAAMRQQSAQIKYSKMQGIMALFDDLEVNQTSVGGLQGMLELLGRDPSIGGITLGEFLQSYLGFGDKAGIEGVDTDQKISELDPAAVAAILGKNNNVAAAVNNIKSMSKAEREYFFGHTYYDSKPITRFRRDSNGNIIKNSEGMSFLGDVSYVPGQQYQAYLNDDNLVVMYNGDTKLRTLSKEESEKFLENGFQDPLSKYRNNALQAQKRIKGGSTEASDYQAIREYSQLLLVNGIINKSELDRSNFMMLNPKLVKGMDEDTLAFASNFASTIGNKDSIIAGKEELALFEKAHILWLDKKQDGEIDNKKLLGEFTNALGADINAAWTALGKDKQQYYGTEDEGRKKFTEQFVNDIIGGGESNPILSVLDKIFSLMTEWYNGNKVGGRQ